MYNMIPPPWMGYGYPPPNNNLDPQTFERAVRIAQKIQSRDEREKERKKHMERREREERRKHAEVTRARFWLAIELYIFGIISQPFVYYGYTHLLKAVTP